MRRIATVGLLRFLAAAPAPARVKPVLHCCEKGRFAPAQLAPLGLPWECCAALRLGVEW